MELLQLNAVMPLSGGQGGLSVNPITTRGADYAHHNTTSPTPGFSVLATALHYSKLPVSSTLFSIKNCKVYNRKDIIPLSSHSIFKVNSPWVHLTKCILIQYLNGSLCKNPDLSKTGVPFLSIM